LGQKQKSDQLAFLLKIKKTKKIKIKNQKKHHPKIIYLQKIKFKKKKKFLVISYIEENNADL